MKASRRSTESESSSLYFDSGAAVVDSGVLGEGPSAVMSELLIHIQNLFSWKSQQCQCQLHSIGCKPTIE